MDRLDAMSVLLAVVEAGSLSAGARKLRVPLTNVSRKVVDLETHLQTRLLVRTSRKVELTAAGHQFVAAAKRILEQVQDAERTAAGEYSAPRGDLTVTAPVVFGRRHVLPVVTAFLAAHPDINVRLLLIDRSVSLVEEHIDLAVRIGRLADSALVAMRLGAVRRVVCATPDFFARHGMPLVPEDLRDLDGVTFEGFPATSVWQFRRDAKPLSVAIRTRLAVNTAEAAVDAALAGVGITRVLSYQVADEVRSGALRLALEAYEPEPIPVSFVYDDKGVLPLKVRAFLDWSGPRLRARLAAL